MKTAYQKPATTIVKVQINSIMTVSTGENGIVNSVSVSYDDYDQQEILSRRNSLWDDYDE